jgi:hypothetical protein
LSADEQETGAAIRLIFGSTSAMLTRRSRARTGSWS